MSSDKAHQYTKATIKRLFLLSGNQCAAPNCTKSLLATDNITIISKICHIEGAKGPRYNPSMTDDDRRHYSNLLLLCDECHTIVDNPVNVEQYPVALLQKWKLVHENKMKTILSRQESLLAAAINAIAKLNFDDNTNEGRDVPKSFSMKDKIEFNAIKRNKYLILEYKVFYYKLNTLYDELERQGSFKKEHLLRYIKNLYLKIKGKYIGQTDDNHTKIQENSDNIIEEMQEYISDDIDKNINSPENIQFSIDVIMVDAFMRCKILEEPK